MILLQVGLGVGIGHFLLYGLASAAVVTVAWYLPDFVSFAVAKLHNRSVLEENELDRESEGRLLSADYGDETEP